MAYDSQELLRQFGRLMRTFKQQGFSAMSNRSRQFWAKQPERGAFRVLHLLHKQDQLTNSQIVEALDIRPSSVSVMVKKLEDDGLVERHESPDDKRVSLISLTEKGQALITSSHDFKNEFADSLFDGLDAAEQEQLGTLLAKLTDSLQDKFKKWGDGAERPEFFDNMPEQFYRGHGFGPWGGHGHHGHHGHRPDFRGFGGFGSDSDKPSKD